MLPKIYRTTVSEFYQNRQTAQKINFSLFMVLLKINNKGTARFVIIVPKVLDKRSVYRHRTKRLVAEEIGKQLENLKNFHYDFSFKMKKIITDKNRFLLGKEIVQMLKDLQIYQKAKPDEKNHS